MKSRRIVLLITNFGPGGAQRVFHDHSLLLSQQFDVTEAVFDESELPILYPTQADLESLNVKRGRTLGGKFLSFVKRCNRLRALVRRKGADLCISHMEGANWVNVLSNSKAKKILFVHGTMLHDYSLTRWVRALRTKLLIPYCYRKADLTIAVSAGIRYELQQRWNLDNVEVIPNFFDINLISTKASEPLETPWSYLFTECEVLITSGRLHMQKQQRFLFPIFRRLLRHRENLKLVIVGDGPLRNHLLKEAEANGLKVFSVWENNQKHSTAYDVYFTGHVDNPFAFLSKSTLFLFPSGWEGFPLAVCEAMICGVPVLAADCPTGPREIIAPGTFDPYYALVASEMTEYGCLLPMTDKPTFEQVWEHTVLELLTDKGKRQSLIRRGQQRMKDYDKAVVVRKLLDAIDKVLRD